jgi:hypothetical protein
MIRYEYLLKIKGTEQDLTIYMIQQHMITRTLKIRHFCVKHPFYKLDHLCFTIKNHVIYPPRQVYRFSMSHYASGKWNT